VSNCLATPKRIEKQIRLQEIDIDSERDFPDVAEHALAKRCIREYEDSLEKSPVRGLDVKSGNPHESCDPKKEECKYKNIRRSFKKMIHFASRAILGQLDKKV
jgi:hypothetical protein